MGRIFMWVGAVACWWIALLWVLGGLRAARSYAAERATLEMNDIIRVMVLRSLGLSLIGVQMLSIALGKPPSFELDTFWPGIIGFILFEAGRIYVIHSKRVGRKTFQ